MSVARVTEITAASKISIEDAIKKGVARADETLDNIKSVWVQDVNAKVKDGEIDEWLVNMKVTFILKD
ncbi:MAG: dodecin domain-containing protein [Rhodobiaceae bacterium]|nr:dodecin domain-containing protein [Rhodobiaceae bacterium]MCC0013379.1 dodecin domain-containing protein [Rhodobiaceae bacterium]MCC0018989.1 dodecin domain-containing protein [Rhodobiaceae bacterium]MCC0061507.1 dodecin domain-containing protein [Rhodobiaceae bacterium]